MAGNTAQINIIAGVDTGAAIKSLEQLNSILSKFAKSSSKFNVGLSDKDIQRQLSAVTKLSKKISEIQLPLSTQNLSKLLKEIETAKGVGGEAKGFLKAEALRLQKLAVQRFTEGLLRNAEVSVEQATTAINQFQAAGSLGGGYLSSIRQLVEKAKSARTVIDVDSIITTLDSLSSASDISEILNERISKWYSALQAAERKALLNLTEGEINAKALGLDGLSVKFDSPDSERKFVVDSVEELLEKANQEILDAAYDSVLSQVDKIEQSFTSISKRIDSGTVESLRAEVARMGDIPGAENLRKAVERTIFQNTKAAVSNDLDKAIERIRGGQFLSKSEYESLTTSLDETGLEKELNARFKLYTETLAEARRQAEEYAAAAAKRGTPSRQAAYAFKAKLEAVGGFEPADVDRILSVAFNRYRDNVVEKADEAKRAAAELVKQVEAEFDEWLIDIRAASNIRKFATKPKSLIAAFEKAGLDTSKIYDAIREVNTSVIGKLAYDLEQQGKLTEKEVQNLRNQAKAHGVDISSGGKNITSVAARLKALSARAEEDIKRTEDAVNEAYQLAWTRLVDSIREKGVKSTQVESFILTWKSRLRAIGQSPHLASIDSSVQAAINDYLDKVVNSAFESLSAIDIEGIAKEFAKQGRSLPTDVSAKMGKHNALVAEFEKLKELDAKTTAEFKNFAELQLASLSSDVYKTTDEINGALNTVLFELERWQAPTSKIGERTFTGTVDKDVFENVKHKLKLAGVKLEGSLARLIDKQNRFTNQRLDNLLDIYVRQTSLAEDRHTFTSPTRISHAAEQLRKLGATEAQIADVVSKFQFANARALEHQLDLLIKNSENLKESAVQAQVDNQARYNIDLNTSLLPELGGKWDQVADILDKKMQRDATRMRLTFNERLDSLIKRIQTGEDVTSTIERFKFYNEQFIDPTVTARIQDALFRGIVRNAVKNFERIGSIGEMDIATLEAKGRSMGISGADIRSVFADAGLDKLAAELETKANDALYKAIKARFDSIAKQYKGVEIDSDIVSKFKADFAGNRYLSEFETRFREHNENVVAARLKDLVDDQEKLIKRAQSALESSALDAKPVSGARGLISDIDASIKRGDTYLKGELENIQASIKNRTKEYLENLIESMRLDLLSAGQVLSDSGMNSLMQEIVSKGSGVLHGNTMRALMNRVISMQAETAEAFERAHIASFERLGQSLWHSSRNSYDKARAAIRDLFAQREQFNVSDADFIAQLRPIVEQAKRLRRDLLGLNQTNILGNIPQVIGEQTEQALVQLQQLKAEFQRNAGSGAVFDVGVEQEGYTQLAALSVKLAQQGRAFTDEMAEFWRKLILSAGGNASQLDGVIANIKTVTFDAEGQAKLRELVSKIRATVADANTAQKVISKTIIDNWNAELAELSRVYGVAATTFKDITKGSLFNTQEQLKTVNAVKQRIEGITKPLQSQLTTLSAQKVDFPEDYFSSLSDKLVRQLNRTLSKLRAELDDAVNRQAVSASDASAMIDPLRKQVYDIRQDFTQQVRLAIYKDLLVVQKEIAAAAKGIGAAPSYEKVNDIAARMQAEGMDTTHLMRSHADALRQQFRNTVRVYLTDLQRMKAGLLASGRSLTGQEYKDITTRGQELAAEAKRLGVNLQRLLARSRAELKKVSDQFGAVQFGGGASGSGLQGKNTGPYGMSQAQYRNMLRMVPMQMTDIFVGALTGQNPFYILLQQGGQLKDMFGGIGNAVKEVGKYLLGWTDTMTKFQMVAATTKRVLAGIAVGAIAGMAVLMKKASDFNAMVQTTTVELRFRGSDVSGDEFRAYSEQMSQHLGIARNTAAEVFKQIAIDAKLPKESFDSLVKGLDDVSTALGNGWDTEGLKETVKLLGDAFKDKDSFLDFASQYAVFNEEQYKTIQQLYDQGDASEAAAYAMQTLTTNVQGAAREAMTPFEETVKTAKEELLQQLQVVGDGLPWQTFMDNISSTMKLLANFIGVVARAASAVAGFISLMGNSLVGAGFKVGSWLKSGDIFLREGNVKSLTERVKNLTEQSKELAAATNNGTRGTAQQLRDYARVTDELSKRQASLDFNKNHLQILKGQKEAMEATRNLLTSDAAKGIELIVDSISNNVGPANQLANATGRAKTNVAGLQRFINSKGANGGRGGGRGGRGGRGGSRSGAQTDRDFENAERYIKQLQQEYDLVSKMNKEQKLLYDWKSGELKMTERQKVVALELARALDARALAEEEIAKKITRQTLELQKQDALQDKRNEYMVELFKLGGSDRQADYLQQLYSIERDAHRSIRDLENELRDKVNEARRNNATGAQIRILEHDYNERIRITREAAEEEKRIWQEHFDELERRSRQWTIGYEDGLREVADWLFDISSEVSSAVQNWASGLADSLATAARTGKLSFKDLANSILDDIARIASRQFVSALFGGFQYGWSATPQSSRGRLAEELVQKNAVQKVFVTNQGFSSFTKAAESFGSVTDAMKSSGFTLGGGSNTGLGPDPWGLSTIPDKTVQRIGAEVSPVIKEGANSMFSGLFDKIGGIFSGIGSSISHLFSSIKLPSFSFGGGGGGFFGNLFSGIGNFFSSLFGLSSGGYTGPGGKYTPAGIVHKGEFVINAASTRKLGLDFLNRLNGYADGGYVTPTPSIVHSNMSKDMNNGLEVNIYNQTDSRITAQRNSSGGLDIFVEQAVNAVAGNIAAGGAVANAIQRTYALNRGVGTQRTGF